jgi:hypothetical protein
MTDKLSAPDQQSLTTLLHLERRALAATSLASLGFSLANETLALVPYRQAVVLSLAPGGKYRLLTASGLVSVAEDSPFTVWLTSFAQTFPRDGGCQRLSFAKAPPEFAEGWEEWLPDHLLAATLQGPEGQTVGLMVYAREAPWQDAELALLDRLHLTYGHCFWSLSPRQRGVGQILGTVLKGRFSKWLWLALVAALFIPVRLSALAPAEVVALNAIVVAAPMEGVIGAIHAEPNAEVKKGDLLFTLDDTSLQSRREVARKALSIASAEALVAEQRAFDDLKSKAELAAAVGRVREKEAELAAVEALLARIAIRAERDGVAVFTDPNDWLGRPVQTGERVMHLADPREAGVLVWLPAADALNLEVGAPIRLFLHTRPLSPLSATLFQTSYQAVPNPEGVSAYRLRGRFKEGQEKPRIGLYGTARVSGNWTVLGYYLFRRPIAAVRGWTGF